MEAVGHWLRVDALFVTQTINDHNYLTADTYLNALVTRQDGERRRRRYRIVVDDERATIVLLQDDVQVRAEAIEVLAQRVLAAADVDVLQQTQMITIMTQSRRSTVLTSIHRP